MELYYSSYDLTSVAYKNRATENNTQIPKFPKVLKTR